MHAPTVLERSPVRSVRGGRPRRRLTPVVRPLECRQLLSATPAVDAPPSATMTQTATFPDLETLPNVSTQAILYFSSTIGTLTEVDLVTSGSFSTEFYAENLGSSSSTIEGTTAGNLSINVPTGAIPVTIPPITETFNASPYDGSLNYGGSSGTEFAAETSSSAPQTMVLTSAADLAAFTGDFRMPISVSGHATGSATSSNGDLSAGFTTQTSVTITVIYHFIPNLPSLDPPSNTTPSSQTPSVPSSEDTTGAAGSGDSSGTSQSGVVPVGPAAPTGTATAAVNVVQPQSSQVHRPASHGRKKQAVEVAALPHKRAYRVLADRLRTSVDAHVRAAKL
jgi:hypothetical protein